MAAPASTISAELDQRARHVANSLGNVAGENWRSFYAHVIESSLPTLQHVRSCIAWAAWVTEPLVCRVGISQRIERLSGTCKCIIRDPNCQFNAYVKNVAIPYMSNTNLMECVLDMRGTNCLESDEMECLTLFEAEVAHRRAPADARHAYIVSDMARMLDQRGVVPGVAATIVRMHTTHDLPLPQPRPLSMHAVQARLDALIAAQPDNHELKRLRQDMGSGTQSSNKKPRST